MRDLKSQLNFLPIIMMINFKWEEKRYGEQQLFLNVNLILKSISSTFFQFSLLAWCTIGSYLRVTCNRFEKQIIFVPIKV